MIPGRIEDYNKKLPIVDLYTADEEKRKAEEAFKQTHFYTDYFQKQKSSTISLYEQAQKDLVKDNTKINQIQIVESVNINNVVYSGCACCKTIDFMNYFNKNYCINLKFGESINKMSLIDLILNFSIIYEKKFYFYLQIKILI